MLEVTAVARNAIEAGSHTLVVTHGTEMMEETAWLTDRDPALRVGQTADGTAIPAPDWVDVAARLGVVPKAGRPYRAQSKRTVERELKEGCLP